MGYYIWGHDRLARSHGMTWQSCLVKDKYFFLMIPFFIQLPMAYVNLVGISDYQLELFSFQFHNKWCWFHLLVITSEINRSTCDGNIWAKPIFVFSFCWDLKNFESISQKHHLKANSVFDVQRVSDKVKQRTETTVKREWIVTILYCTWHTARNCA